MKVRNDFVSNSSSSSFIIAINKEYSLDAFVKDFAKACINKKYQYHDKNLESRNKRILDFCLNTYELLFLGTLKINTIERVYSKEDFIKTHMDKVQANVNDDWRKTIYNQTLAEWDRNLQMIDKAKEKNVDKWVKSTYGRNYVDQNGYLHVFFDVVASNIIVDSDIIKYNFNRNSYSTKKIESEDAISQRVDSILKYSELYSDPKKNRFFPNIECYRITENSILNTKDLIKRNSSLSLDGFPKLNVLLDKIQKGDQIFALTVNYEGDMYNNYTVYMEDNAKGIDSLAVEFIRSESM